MKINKIVIHNLNSLKGKHTIDFEGEELKQVDLLAIVGDTGAGKTTILDAVLLALFNKTPRYNKSLSAKELEQSGGIVTRGESEAGVSIDFEIKKNGSIAYYRAKWSARKGKKGEAKHKIQAYHMEFSALGNLHSEEGEILAKGAESKVRPLIEEIVGLNYDQFIKGVMLSQGAFAKFLRANKKDRNALLEKITRSFDFREISKASYLKNKTLQDAILQLKQEKEAQKCLSAEEIILINEEIERLQPQSVALEEEIKVLKEQLNNFKALKQKQAEKLQTDTAIQELTQECTAFAEEEQKLQNYEACLPYLADFEALKNKEDQLQEELKSLHDLSGAVEGLLMLKEQLKKEVEKRKQAHAEFNKAFEEKLVLIQQTEVLDQQIKAHQSTLAHLEPNHQSAVKKQQAIQQKIVSLQEKSEKLQEQREQKQAWLEQFQQLEHLRNDLPFLENIKAQMADQQQAIESKLNTINSDKLVGKIKDALAKQQLADMIPEWISTTEKSCTELQEQLAYKWDEDTFKAQISLLEQAERLFKDQQQVEQEQQLCQQNIKLVLAEKVKTKAEHQQLTVQLKVHENEFDIAKKEYENTKLMHDQGVAYLRSKLLPQEQCPVCGATDHPLADQPTDQSLISRAEKNVQLTEKQKVSTEKQLMDSEGRLKQAIFKIEEYEKSLKSIGEKSQQIADEITKIKASNLTGTPLQSENIPSTIATVHTAKQQADMLKRYELMISELSEIKIYTDRITEAEGKIAQRIAPYQQLIPDADLSALTQHAQLFETNKEALNNLSEACSIHRNDLQNAKEQLELNTAELTKSQVEIEQLNTVLKDLQQQRQTIFGDQETENEKQQWAAKQQASTTALQNEEQKLALNKQEIEQKQQLTIASREKQQRLKSSINALKEAFEQALAKLKMSERSAFETVLKYKAQAEGWKAKREALHQENTRLKERLQGTEKNIRELQSKIGDQSIAPEKMDDLLQTKAEEHHHFTQEMANLKAKLNHNDSILSYSKSLDQKIKKQAENAKVWYILNELIGSAEGDKFNNYAQSLMLGILLEYANKYLNMLNKRYQFVGIPEHSNEDDLYIRDIEMGNEIRAIKTLSGGETFLLALSMALGLSDMASQKVKIESLFIDEGFGTLDKATLEEVLATLENLQDKTGKKIIIISHVPELQERISTQIRLEKTGAGYSKLTIQH
ncbi:AAA family ATPase [Persicobacter psychrovividus]|uniref:Nuclease SbcCD subunit C n=1 Tax=Persicobacter psychrovividus TaxID=387638 RepID=A0ABM7VHQ4_9BACT|nr:nuclease SbcCD subunit C [Persicobacter psychrovividus]